MLRVKSSRRKIYLWSSVLLFQVIYIKYIYLEKGMFKDLLYG